MRSRPFPSRALRAARLQDFVFRQLCELILNGEIAPGQLITIQSLADAFGVSAMPVREALQRLTAARVLTVISSRSIGIPPLDAGAAVRLAAGAAGSRVARRRVGDAQHRRTRHRRTCRRVSPGWKRRRGSATTSNICASIARSTSKSIEAARSDALIAIIETLWLQISPYFHLLHASGNYFKANEQHEIMLSALRARDEAALSLAVRNDIEAAYRVLVPLLDSEKQK